MRMTMCTLLLLFIGGSHAAIRSSYCVIIIIGVIGLIFRGSDHRLLLLLLLLLL